MSKPTDIGEWASDLGAQVEEPIAGRKAAGWYPGDKPPSQILNWLLNVAYQWQVWLNGLQNEALDWTNTQTFSGGVTGDLNVSAGSVHALTDDVVADNGDLLAPNGDVSVGGDVIAQGILNCANGAYVDPVDGYNYDSPRTRYAYCHAYEMYRDANVDLTTFSMDGDAKLVATAVAGLVGGRIRLPKGATITAFHLLCANTSGSAHDLTLFSVGQADLPVTPTAQGGLTNTLLAGVATFTIPAGSGTPNWAFRALALIGQSVVADGYVSFHFTMPASANGAQVQLARVTYTTTHEDSAA
jgi:hypothetical protein